MMWNNKVWEQVKRYDDVCGKDPTCTLTFDVGSGGIDSQLFIYYEIRYRLSDEGVFTKPIDDSLVQRAQNSFEERSSPCLKHQNASQ
jgi:hypothetical protein